MSLEHLEGHKSALTGKLCAHSISVRNVGRRKQDAYISNDLRAVIDYDNPGEGVTIMHFRFPLTTAETDSIEKHNVVHADLSQYGEETGLKKLRETNDKLPRKLRKNH